jgi:hypothetical protein
MRVKLLWNFMGRKKTPEPLSPFDSVPWRQVKESAFFGIAV